MDDLIPYVAVGNEELDSKTQNRIKEIMNSHEDSIPEKDGLELLSLVLSRGKHNDGKAIKCKNCNSLYLVFPREDIKCSCGEKLQ